MTQDSDEMRKVELKNNLGEALGYIENGIFLTCLSWLLIVIVSQFFFVLFVHTWNLGPDQITFENEKCYKVNVAGLIKVD